MPRFIGSELRKAQEMEKIGHLSSAQIIYQKILSKFPEHKLAVNSYQRLIARVADERTVARMPSKKKLKKLIALVNGGESQMALEQTLPLTLKYPDDSLLLQIIATALSALKTAEQTSDNPKIGPDYASAYNHIGTALQKNGCLDDAIVNYKRALMIKPRIAEVYYNMGCALQKKEALNEALESYQSALEIKPDYASASNNLGTLFHNRGALEEALACYRNALAANPEYAEAYHNMGNTQMVMGESKAAITSFRLAAKINPNDADLKHVLASITGKQTSAPPISYVASLFDYYAANFEQSLLGDLHYAVPTTIAQIMSDLKTGNSFGSVLDMGCGTGLAGVSLASMSDNLHGIDISRKMLQRAKRKQLYDQLSNIDIIQYLTKSRLGFDYFVAADVFNYIGDLSKIFELIQSRNRRYGRLVFSTEHQNEDGFYLNKSGRYSHSNAYIKHLCAVFNYQILHFSTSNLRKDKGQFLIGGFYVLEF